MKQGTTMSHDHNHHRPEAPSFWHSRAFLVFLGFAGIALVLLWKEHSAHILGAIPYLFLLACPLMHIFMHGGHGGHGAHHGSRGGTTPSAGGGWREGDGQ
jgi:hypothetical protein